MGGPSHDERIWSSVSARTKQRSNINNLLRSWRKAIVLKKRIACYVAIHRLNPHQDSLATESRNHSATYSGRAHNSRDLLFQSGSQMEQVFQSLIDRSRSPLDLDRVKTIFGDKKRRTVTRERKARQDGEWWSRHLTMTPRSSKFITAR